MQVATEQQASVLVVEAPAPLNTPQPKATQDVMDVDSAQPQQNQAGGKRKAEDDIVSEEHKKARIGEYTRYSITLLADMLRRTELWTAEEAR